MGLSATILGASGYSGGEALRLLARHPAMDVVASAAGSSAGRSVAEVHPHLSGVLDDSRFVNIDEAAGTTADVCFSCLPAGELAGHLSVCAARIIIDLADDFRGEAGSARGWVYGLPELGRKEIGGATRVANPGCYPTASLLCLAPFARAGALAAGEPVIIDALSGTSGAGRTPTDALSFSGFSGGVNAYGTTSHRHIPEIERGLARFGGVEATVSFTPHLVPTARGVLVTARARPARSIDDAGALAILRDFYTNEPFVDVIEGWPSTKPLVGSNRAHVSARVDRRAGWIVCSAAIDNLGKGAAGQAIQNANIALGLEETTGLESLGVWP